MFVAIAMTPVVIAIAMDLVRHAIGIVIAPGVRSAVRNIKIAIVIATRIVIASENQASSTLLERTRNERRTRLVQARHNSSRPKVRGRKEQRLQPLRTPLRVNAPSALAAIAADVDAEVDAVAVVKKAA